MALEHIVHPTSLPSHLTFFTPLFPILLLPTSPPSYHSFKDVRTAAPDEKALPSKPRHHQYNSCCCCQGWSPFGWMGSTWQLPKPALMQRPASVSTNDKVKPQQPYPENNIKTYFIYFNLRIPYPTGWPVLSLLAPANHCPPPPQPPPVAATHGCPAWVSPSHPPLLFEHPILLFARFTSSCPLRLPSSP